MLQSKAELQRSYRILGQGRATNTCLENDSLSSGLDAVFMQAGLRSFIFYSGLRTSDINRITFRLAVSAAFGVSLFVLIGVAWPLLIPILYGVFEYFRIQKRTETRAQDFERDYPAFLLSLASAIRTGIDPIVALSRAEELFNSDTEMAKELGKFREELDKGGAEDDCIRRFALSINHPDLKLFRTAFILARREGSSLGSCLQRLAKVTRQRQSFRRKIKGAVAMQKLSSLGIGGCALLIASFQVISNYRAVEEAVNDALGSKLLMVGIGLIGVGLVWMLRMTRTKI